MERKDIIAQQAQLHDSFYLYDGCGILERTECLKSNFPGIEFLYSIKCNPHPQVLRTIFSQGFGADAASLGEVLLAGEAGLSKNQIYYSAPGKTEKDIETAITRAVLIADSLSEIRRIQNAAERLGIVAEIGIRINPDFTFYADCGMPSKFGIDQDQALDFLQNQTCPNVRITGIHVHLKSQELQADVLAGYYRKMFRLAEIFQRACGGLEYVNLGSGIGIPYSGKDSELDMPLLGAALEKELAGFRSMHPSTRVMIEVGRYAVCKSGVYVTKVIDRKVSRGKSYLILKNTLNGFLRPSLAQLVMHYSQETSPAGTEPLFTSGDAFGFLTLKEDAPTEYVTLVGNLCTAADVVADDILMPRMEPGDVVIMTNAGSYAAVLSPMQFSAQEKPAELFLHPDGRVV